MQNITSTAALKNAIQLLEAEQAAKGKLLKEQLYLTYESLKPINLLRSALKDISASPYLINDITGTAMSLASGIISKKIIAGKSGNLLRKLLGSVLQLGVTNFMERHSDIIRSFIQVIFRHVFSRKETDQRKR
ncbi:MAG: hypothetical protein LLG13_02030 [Bacteroidales bacterium]|nr:hypothetical protein [Bacteroidales bacterium]